MTNCPRCTIRAGIVCRLMTLQTCNPLHTRRVGAPGHRATRGDIFALYRLVVLHLLICLFGVALSAGRVAHAQDYPVKPLKLIVPFPPGAGTDAVARLVAQKLAEQMNATIVVDNRTGAGGAIGADLVARADPDGHTLLFVASPFTTVAAASANAGYDPVRHFAGIALIATGPLVFVMSPAVPVASDRKSTRLNSSHLSVSRMPSSA